MKKANLNEKNANVQNAQVKNANTQPREKSLFLKNWDVIKLNIGGANWAYRAMYACASPELRAALIDPKMLTTSKDASTHAKYNAYVAYANEHKGTKGVSAWFAYLWAQKEMREYLSNAGQDDKRAKAIAKVVRAQRNEKQQKAVAKK